ncbi:hypothetical protein KM043_009867 [Ampulex compressa]|nr:hypothetical protein KM043_009867 [Ampulex compressa]
MVGATCDTRGILIRLGAAPESLRSGTRLPRRRAVSPSRRRPPRASGRPHTAVGSPGRKEERERSERGEENADGEGKEVGNKTWARRSDVLAGGC